MRCTPGASAARGAPWPRRHFGCPTGALQVDAGAFFTGAHDDEREVDHHISVGDQRVNRLAVKNVALLIDRLGPPQRRRVEGPARHPDDLLHRGFVFQGRHCRFPYFSGRAGDSNGESHPGILPASADGET
jgi:hypothetical protein